MENPAVGNIFLGRRFSAPPLTADRYPVAFRDLPIGALFKLDNRAGHDIYRKTSTRSYQGVWSSHREPDEIAVRRTFPGLSMEVGRLRRAGPIDERNPTLGGEPDLGPLAIVGALGIAAFTIWWINRSVSKGVKATFDALEKHYDTKVPPGALAQGPLPTPGVPLFGNAASSSPAYAASASSGALDGIGKTFPSASASYFLVLYTVRFVPSSGTWGEYNEPKAFRGHRTTMTDAVDRPLYSSPDDDMVAYLDALGVTNAQMGFWIAYRVPVLADGSYGAPSPWISGRFGDLHGLNPNVPFFAHDAVVTEYAFTQGNSGETLAAEIKLA
jgi:hypothetical protein